MKASGFQPARELAQWKARVTAAWPSVHVTHVESGGWDAVPQVGDDLHLRATIATGGLTSEDLAVEVVYGRAHEGDRLDEVQHLPLEFAEGTEGTAVFAGTVPLARAGSFGYTVRVVPNHRLLASPAELGLIAVAK